MSGVSAATISAPQWVYLVLLGNSTHSDSHLFLFQRSVSLYYYYYSLYPMLCMPPPKYHTYTPLGSFANSAGRLLRPQSLPSLNNLRCDCLSWIPPLLYSFFTSPMTVSSASEQMATALLFCVPQSAPYLHGSHGLCILKKNSTSS